MPYSCSPHVCSLLCEAPFTQHAAFGIQPGFACICSFFWLSSIPLCRRITLFIHLLVERCLSCSQFLAMADEAMTRFCVQVSMWMEVSLSLGPICHLEVPCSRALQNTRALCDHRGAGSAALSCSHQLESLSLPHHMHPPESGSEPSPGPTKLSWPPPHSEISRKGPRAEPCPEPRVLDH